MDEPLAPATAGREPVAATERANGDRAAWRPLPPHSPEPVTATEATEPATASPGVTGILDRLGLGGGRLGRWTRILSAYFTAQGAVQLLGVTAGLLFIHFMPIEEYALYTLAFSVVSFFHFATDLGSTSSLVYFFHHSRRSEEEFAPYVAAVESLRRIAFILGGFGVLILFPLTARTQGFGFGESVLIAIAILCTVWFQISGAIRILNLRLGDRYGLSYKAELAGGGIRLALALALVALALLPAWLAVSTSVAGAAVIARVARSGQAQVSADLDLGPYRRRVLRYLAPTLPSGLYFSIQAPLVVWLAATFGSTRNIAEVGALGRLGMVVSLFSGLVGVVILPRLSRIVDDRLYRLRFLQYGGALLAVALMLLAGGAAFPRAFLFLLGRQYDSLSSELLLVIASAGVGLVGGYIINVNVARSWTRWHPLIIGLLITTQVVLVATLSLATTNGVLLFGLLTGVVSVLLNLIIAFTGFLKPQLVFWDPSRTSSSSSSRV